MRRAAISVATNIAEGDERPDREFCRFLTIALGSNAEVVIAGDLGCIDAATAVKIIDHTDHIIKMIRRLIQYLQPSG